VADFPFAVPAALRDDVSRYVDVEGKIPTALERLGHLADQDVVVLEGSDGVPDGVRVRQLQDLGARVTVARGAPSATGLRAPSADAVVSFWSAFRPSTGGSLDAEADLAEADRILRPGGRLLVVHDYARDDLSRVLPPERSAAAVAWSRRDGWFSAHGFRIHVIHAFWTFPDLAHLDATVEALFGRDARRLLGDLHRPRLSWKVVVYDRLRGGAAPG
jgi:hypothetical protein